MCGSGSTMVACNELGLPSIGMDVSPYAVKATRCKGFTLTSTQVSDLTSNANKVVEIAKSQKASFSRFDQDIEKYFSKENFQQLVNLKQSVASLEESVFKEILEFSLLAILEDCSDRKKDGNGLAKRLSKIKDCYAAFLSKVELIAEDYKEYPHSTNSSAFVHDAKYLNDKVVLSALGSREAGAIIFSPPYANSFDYFESYKLELIFSEWTISKELHQKRKSLIRNYRLSSREKLHSDIPEVELLCDEVLTRIPEKEKITGVRDARTRLVPNMLRSYFADMGKVIESGMQILTPGGYMHIVVDQSAYVGVPIPTDTILALIGEKAGFEVVDITYCRKAKTSAQQLKSFPYLKDLLRETIVVLRKPGSQLKV
jgi:site-specific DNA-methyltransferase (adenine-specific)